MALKKEGIIKAKELFKSHLHPKYVNPSLVKLLIHAVLARIVYTRAPVLDFETVIVRNI